MNKNRGSDNSAQGNLSRLVLTPGSRRYSGNGLLSGRLRGLVILVVMMLGLYPIAELTRVIMFYWQQYDATFRTVGQAEIVIMWALYLAIIPFLAWAWRKEGKGD